MISYVKGILAEKAKDRIVVESGMMGIGIFVPMSVLEVLPPLGEEVKIYTHLQVREDDMSLYGFLSRSDLEMFRQLLAALLRAGNHDPFSCQRLRYHKDICNSIPDINRIQFFWFPWLTGNPFFYD